MLLILDLRTKESAFPIEALQKVDSTLIAAGFKKEVHSVVQPGRAYSVTYEGPSMEKSRIEKILKTVAETNQINISIEVEESVRFP